MSRWVQYFSLLEFKVVSNRMTLFISLPSVIVRSPKDAATFFTPAAVISRQYFTLFWEVRYFLDPIPPLLLYIKPPLPINKQFSIDSFLDWEGLHWDFSSTLRSPPPFQCRRIRHAKIKIHQKSFKLQVKLANQIKSSEMNIYDLISNLKQIFKETNQSSYSM